MESAEARELGVLQSWYHAEDPRLLGVAQLGLEANHIPQRTERVVLAKLDDGVRPAAGARIIEADRLHRPEP